MNKRASFEQYGITDEQISATDLTLDVLSSIESNYNSLISRLESYGNEIVELFQPMPEVYAIKCRICTLPELFTKIVKTKSETPEKKITSTNYLSFFNDLISIKVLYLNNDTVKMLHDFITKTWNIIQSANVYLTEKSSQDIKDFANITGSTIYRGECQSFNYHIQCGNTRKSVIAEVCVRNSLEDSWFCADSNIKSLYSDIAVKLVQYQTVLKRAYDQAGVLKKLIEDVSPEVPGTTKTELKAPKSISGAQSIQIGEDDKVVIKAGQDDSDLTVTRGTPVEDLTRTDFVNENDLHSHSGTNSPYEKDEVIFNPMSNDASETQTVRSVSETVELKARSKIGDDVTATSYIPREQFSGDVTRKNIPPGDKPVIIKASDDIVINLTTADNKSHKKKKVSADVSATVAIPKNKIEKGK